MKKSAVVITVTSLVCIYACGGAQPPPAEVAAIGNVDGGQLPLASIGDAALSPGTSASADPPSASADGGGFAGAGKLCGCKLCAPVVSDDACTQDSDCAAEKPCHATRCVAAANVTPPPAKVMCSRILLCHTTDANSCSCYQGKCALVPR